MKAALGPQRLSAAVGPACRNLISDHFGELGTNKRGWPTTNFWSQARKATSWQQVSEGTKISIAKIGVAQRYFGGVIEPVNAKMIAYPIDAESYGKVPSEFPDLFVITTKKGKYLVRRETTGIKGALKFLFRLRESVDQKPDPNVLPTREEIASTAVEAIQEAVRS